MMRFLKLRNWLGAAAAEATPEAVEAVSVPEAVATGSENLSVPGAVATGSEVQAENVEAPTDSKPKAKPHHRHWRQRRNLALEFAPGEAVSVTRRLYRSGESEYLLNDRPCRLRDIQDLFSGTGLAGGHYAIIEQGRIGQILSAKPMDRRTIIEEAAGITKFRVRQRAAEARLESARSNLSRVADIISEIERQVNSLRRQAAKARRYRILREELRELLRRVYVGEEESLVALLDQTQAELDRAGQEEQQLAAALTEREEASRTATQNARTFEDELAQVRAAVAEGALQRDRRIRERVYQEEQIETLSKRRTEIEAEVAALTLRLTLVESELERLGALDATLTAETEQTSSLLRTAEETYAARLAEVARAEEEIENARPELLKHTVAGERLLELGRQIESSIEKLAQQAEGLAREGERATASHQTATTEAEKLNGQIIEARAKLARLVAERQGALKAVVEGHERVSDTDAELTRVRDDYSRTQARLESFKDLDERRAHFSLAVQEAFSANEAEQFHLIGTLADSIKVEAQWERAVEGALGSSLQSVLSHGLLRGSLPPCPRRTGGCQDAQRPSVRAGHGSARSVRQAPRGFGQLMGVVAIVYVGDVAASLAFYERVLEVERDHLDEDGSYGEFKSGIGFAANWHAERHLDLPFRRAERDGIPLGFELDFAVDDVDAVFRRACEAGAVPVWEPQDKPWGRAAMFRDADGVLVHVNRA